MTFHAVLLLVVSEIGLARCFKFVRQLCISRVDHKESSHFFVPIRITKRLLCHQLLLQLLHIKALWVISALTIGITKGILICMKDVSSAGKAFFFSPIGLFRSSSSGACTDSSLGLWPPPKKNCTLIRSDKSLLMLVGGHTNGCL